jgi:regulator of PEP synthase PpsR (kinase-PPPase family)
MQFSEISTIEHLWAMVRTKNKLRDIIAKVKLNPGVIIYTIVDRGLEDLLQKECATANIPCISVLSSLISELSSYLHMRSSNEPGRQHLMGKDYFARIEAINFAIMHDDGQSLETVSNADIIIVGPSRTSKSPTSIYLAYKGFKTANIPFVIGHELPSVLCEARGPLIVGLLVSADRLVQIRKNRMLHLTESAHGGYIDPLMVEQELLAARRIFTEHDWPIIDVSRRSVEEIAASILIYYHDSYKS